MGRTKLLERRKKKGLTQSDVAERAGIDRSHYSSIELGNLESITLKTAVAIGKVLDYRVDPKGLFDICHDEEQEAKE